MTSSVWKHYEKNETKGFGADKSRWGVRCKFCVANVVALERSRQLNAQAESGIVAQTEDEIRKQGLWCMHCGHHHTDLRAVITSDNPQPFTSKIDKALHHLAKTCTHVDAHIKLWAATELAAYNRGKTERAHQRAVGKENVNSTARQPQASCLPHRTSSETTLIGGEEPAGPPPAQRSRTDQYQPPDGVAAFEYIAPDAWPRERAAKFAADLCRLMVVCNIAWSSVEHPYWRYFFQEWLPGVPVPGRKELSGRILDEQVELCVAEMKTRTGGKFATGQCDGWKDIARRALSPRCGMLSSRCAHCRRHTARGLTARSLILSTRTTSRRSQRPPRTYLL